MKNKIGFAFFLILLTALITAANSSPHLKIPGAWTLYDNWIIWKVYIIMLKNYQLLCNELTIYRSTPSAI